MTVELLEGDCLRVLAELPDNSFDSCVTDPPYHLTSIVKRFGAPGSAEAKDRDGLYRRASAGFMGKRWDGGDIAFRPETWAAVLRVLKPGGHLLAFAGTRGYHRMICAIEDAGFEVRDCVGWLYGSGFPKSHNQHGEWEGWGTALKPAWEPICVARKPLTGTVAKNLAAHGVGALNIDGCRVGGDVPKPCKGTGWAAQDKKNAEQGYRPVAYYADQDGVDYVPSAAGRWPANVLHDGSEEVLQAFPEAPGQLANASSSNDSRETQHVYGAMQRGSNGALARGDTGSAARFFYCAKASKKDRAGSKHPTVKPIALMRYLCRLVTPPGGVVLDPFAGSGTTGRAALDEGFRAVLIEREVEYIDDIRCRFGMPSVLEDMLA